MIIHKDDKLAQEIEIVDSTNNVIRGVISYDTETKEAEIYVRLSNNDIALYWKEGVDKNPSILPVNADEVGKEKFEIVTAKVCLLGCKARNIKTKEEIK